MNNATIETVWSVVVDGRMDGLYLFRDWRDAERFLLAVEQAGGTATCTEEPVNHAPGTAALIEAEADDA